MPMCGAAQSSSLLPPQSSSSLAPHPPDKQALATAMGFFSKLERGDKHDHEASSSSAGTPTRAASFTITPRLARQRERVSLYLPVHRCLYH